MALLVTATQVVGLNRSIGPLKILILVFNINRPKGQYIFWPYPDKAVVTIIQKVPSKYTENHV